MLGTDAATLITYALILLIALPFHELSHAWTADRLGDPTPRSQGRLTLNPIAHLDPMGSLLLLFAGFGWAKPVQVDAALLRRRSPAALMLVSASGPLSNALLALLGCLPFRLGLLSTTFSYASSFPTAGQFFATFVLINLVLMLFNLLPIAPLDGEEVLAFFLPPTGRRLLASFRPYGPFVLLGLIALGYLGHIDPLGVVIFEPARWLAIHLIGL